MRLELKLVEFNIRFSLRKIKWLLYPLYWSFEWCGWRPTNDKRAERNKTTIRYSTKFIYIKSLIHDRASERATYTLKAQIAQYSQVFHKNCSNGFGFGSKSMLRNSKTNENTQSKRLHAKFGR